MDKFKEFLRSEWFMPLLRFCVFIVLIFVLFISICTLWLSLSYSYDLREVITKRYVWLALGSILGLVINAR